MDSQTTRDTDAFPRLHGLRHVSLRTTGLRDAVDFYAGPWGLELVEDVGGSVFLRAAGPEHHVLELHEAERNGLDHVAFAVVDPRDVDAAAIAAERMGIEVVAEPGPSGRPGGGYRTRIVDLEGRVVELSANVQAVAARAPSPAPVKVAHVVLNTVDIDAACDFYTRLLGLRVSDWSEHQMVFLRCNADHHSIAFNQADWASVNHVAYEVPGLDAFMRRLGALHRAGCDPEWGPGRHGPGDNAFAYYVDPAGHVPEVTAEVAQVEERTWLPRVWPRVPELSDLWGTAGPPSPRIRELMAGQADGTPGRPGATGSPR